MIHEKTTLMNRINWYALTTPARTSRIICGIEKVSGNMLTVNYV